MKRPDAPMLTAADIRQKYLDFFARHDHTVVASAPLVPANDPTLLFTSAGMVQFKALYSGAVPLPYSRAASCQKCLRAGGKGSDLENVGKTLRHFTFFEMLGNFSFGDYFKEGAIVWGWDFCTGPEWLNLPANRLWPTVFGKKKENGDWIVDDEAEKIWREKTGIVNPVTRLDEKENFWGPAGETGACGPCSEIKFFMGSEEQLREYQALGERAKAGDEAARQKIARDIVELGDLFLEIWNLVFPQYDQQLDGSRLPLKNRGIDTGLGLERTTTAVQFIQSGGKIRTPYETDLLRPMVDAVAEVAGVPYPTIVGGEAAEAAIRAKNLDPDAVRLAINACTDHARTVTFALAEGIVPSNEGRGYVIRRILRRAARFGKKLGINEPFLWKLVKPIVKIMGDIYPELKSHPDVIEKTIRAEEERFNRTLHQGSDVLDEMLGALPAGGQLSGDNAYKLYDTYGFHLELTAEAAEERGFTVDLEGFNKAMADAKARARASWKGSAGAGIWQELTQDLGDKNKTEFLGYDSLKAGAKILALIHDRRRVERLEEGQAGVVVLDRTPFYAEAGGQIGDRGQIADARGGPLFNIEDTQKTDSGYYLHFGEAQAPLEVGQQISAEVDASRRIATIANHSSVHLMQAALKRVIGGHVTQQGSWVGPEGSRFDFTNPEPIGDEQLRRIEELVNAEIRANHPVVTKVMDLADARKSGAIAPFEEKYGSKVRVVTMGGDEDYFSREFCGGTHVSRTGDIGQFVIVGESSVASGIRRIEARAGASAFDTVRHAREVLARLSRRLSVQPEALEDRLDTMQEEIKKLRHEVEQARAERARAQMAQAAESGKTINGVKFIEQQIDNADHNTLVQVWDALRQKSSDATVGLLYSIVEGKVNMIVGVTDDIAGKKLKAGDLLNAAATVLGGKGGGKPNLARGGGNTPEKIIEAIQAAESALEKSPTT